MHHASESIITKIEGYEGFSAKPYWLGDGRWTIGFGETSGVGQHTGPWTRTFAAQKLRTRVRRDFEPYIHKLGLPLNQNQFDALLSAIYNLGPGILDRGRSLGNALRASRKNYAAWVRGVQSAIREYDMPGSPFHEGLKRRRDEEAKLFAKPAPTKRSRLQAELDRLRAQVRTDFHGNWKLTPKRRRRAESIKQWLGSHPKQ